jgi:predicted DNA-binding protein with PD1-like motif
LVVVAQLARDWFERHLISAARAIGVNYRSSLGSCWNRNTGRAFIRLDYSGCQSRGSSRFTASRLMKFKAAFEGGGRTFVLVLDQGEEAFAAVTDFANDKAIAAASVAAIGAFESAKVGWFDLAAKRYSPISVDEQCEVLSLLGDIAEGDDGKASLHLHAVLGLRDGSVWEVTFCLVTFGLRWRSRSSRRRQSFVAGGEQI